ncbi:NLR family CARD domain-containing protein 4 [Holothuria leucospilota]|uniref:NLR family CARD domain-containing protein 4 n=1 Tax=Holothuria leucospilota TaxID=206669 RepID=A0A9Q1CT33_HOLLE|nr:NLR family CARD domain-containing protein 4 [Holothuria leucospilota]
MIEQPLPCKSKENVNVKAVFIQQLQNKYKLQYDAIRPIPYIRDKMYNVKSIFVESTIEALLFNDQFDDSDTGSWEKLNNYHQLLKFDSSNSSRKIVQGDPGYGKSTLTLQMAYDWSTKQTYSPLCEKEILILLRLRQLFGITSIYRAIRLFLLPRDTIINETDIKDILQKSSSAVVILDGFDEYPHQDGENLTDVNRIIAGNMFQEFHVIVCSRPLSMPGQIPPRTQRTRLNGFDRRAQQVYIQKAVTNNTEVAEKIHSRLKENPVLGDFCQVPLFFVMFAHMTKENEKFQAVNSATSFFRHVISCFHSHLQNKVSDENVKHYKIFENDHTNLDELSFQVLSSNQEITWTKDELRVHIGDQFYDYYVRLGILCEEEIFDSSIDEFSSEVSPYRVDVHFYHKLFCEWYAAHHLSRLAENMNFLKLKKLLRKLDLFELHYVFRFACGLNAEAARKILKHLNSVKGGEQFAILCTLEQSGKFTDIKENVSQLCSEAIHLCRDDSRVLQRSTIQLMIIASRNEVSLNRKHAGR